MERIGSSGVNFQPMLIGGKRDAEKIGQKSVYKPNDKAVQDSLYALGANAKAGIKTPSNKSALPTEAFAPSPIIKNGIGGYNSNINNFGPSSTIRGFGTV